MIHIGNMFFQEKCLQKVPSMISIILLSKITYGSYIFLIAWEFQTRRHESSF